MKAISTILVPVDLSAKSKIGFEAACQAAEVFGAKILHLVHVIQYSQFALDVPAYSGVVLQQSLDALLDAAKERLADLSCAEGRLELIRETRIGAPAREIVVAAEQCGAGLIVLATANRGPMGRLMLGSVAHTVVRASQCPVLIVAEDRPWRLPHRVVAAIDLSPISEGVLARATDVARAAKCEVNVFSVHDLLWVPPTWMETYPIPLDDAHRAALAEHHRAAVESLISRVGDRDVLTTTTISRLHPPAKLIVEHAKEIDADLIVVGSSGHNAWQRLFLGSTATRVISHAHCPVLVVPAP